MSLESSQKTTTNANSNDEITTSFLDDDKISQCTTTHVSEDNDFCNESTESFIFNTDSCDYNKKHTTKNNESKGCDYNIKTNDAELIDCKQDNANEKICVFDSNQVRIKYRREIQCASYNVCTEKADVPFISLQNDSNIKNNDALNKCTNDQKYVNDDFEIDLSFLEDVEEQINCKNMTNVIWESTTQDEAKNAIDTLNDTIEKNIYNDDTDDLFCTDDFEIVNNDIHEDFEISSNIEYVSNDNKKSSSERNSVHGKVIEQQNNIQKDLYTIKNDKENVVESTNCNSKQNNTAECAKTTYKQLDNNIVHKEIIINKKNMNKPVQCTKNMITSFTTANNKKISIKEESIVFANKINNEINNTKIIKYNDSNSLDAHNKYKHNKDVLQYKNSYENTSKNEEEKYEQNIHKENNYKKNKANETTKSKISQNRNKEGQQNTPNENNSKKNKTNEMLATKISQNSYKGKQSIATTINRNTKFTPPTNKQKALVVPGIQKNKLPSGRPMRSYLKPEIGHVSTENNYQQNMKSIYNAVMQHFASKDKFTFANHYKWSWMHYYMNNSNEIKTEMYKSCGFEINDKGTNNETVKFYINTCNFLVTEIKKRFNNEYSILKRIVEGDDISIKYMVLAVTEIKKDVLNVFDGFYAVNVKIDTDLQKMLISQKIRIGTYLRIFGAKLMIQNKALTDIKDECVLFLNYNNVKICNSQTLGYQKRKGYCIQIKDIIKTGGDICGLELKIMKTIERKIQIKVNSYVNIIDENEKEMQKIEKLVNDAKHKNNEDIDTKLVWSFKKVVKMLVRDVNENECILTWYDCEEVAINECYRFCLLKIGKMSIGLHLVTGYSTVAIKIKKLNEL
ncbi:Breast cancer 2 [Binucleata daphniae]